MRIGILLILLILAGCKSATDPISTAPTHSACDTCKFDFGGPSIKTADTTTHNFRWRVYNLPNESYLYSTAVTPAGDIIVVGQSVYQLTDAGFVDISPSQDGRSLSGGLQNEGLFARTVQDYWLSGYDCRHSFGNYAVVISGEYDTAGHHTVHACWWPADNDMFAVGDFGTIIHFDGVNWTAMNSGTAKWLYSISGTAHNNIWASGTNPDGVTSVLLHYDGSSWIEDPISMTSRDNKIRFNQVCAVDTGMNRFVYACGRFLGHSMNGGPWSFDTTGIPSGFLDYNENATRLAVASPKDLWMTANGCLTHWNGRSWFNVMFPDASNIYIHSISTNGDKVCAVGSHYYDHSWVAVGSR